MKIWRSGVGFAVLGWATATLFHRRDCVERARWSEAASVLAVFEQCPLRAMDTSPAAAHHVRQAIPCAAWRRAAQWRYSLADRPGTCVVGFARVAGDHIFHVVSVYVLVPDFVVVYGGELCEIRFRGIF